MEDSDLEYRKLVGISCSTLGIWYWQINCTTICRILCCIICTTIIQQYILFFTHNKKKRQERKKEKVLYKLTAHFMIFLICVEIKIHVKSRFTNIHEMSYGLLSSALFSEFSPSRSSEDEASATSIVEGAVVEVVVVEAAAGASVEAAEVVVVVAEAGAAVVEVVEAIEAKETELLLLFLLTTKLVPRP